MSKIASEINISAANCMLRLSFYVFEPAESENHIRIHVKREPIDTRLIKEVYLACAI